jgi:hypothetical protein
MLSMLSGVLWMFYDMFFGKKDEKSG